MEGNTQQQKATRELARVFNGYNKHTGQLRRNLKETNAFFREIRQNYSNACASTINSDSASLDSGGFFLNARVFATASVVCLPQIKHA